jgi:hypothetical protein
MDCEGTHPQEDESPAGAPTGAPTGPKAMRLPQQPGLGGKPGRSRHVREPRAENPSYNQQLVLGGDAPRAAEERAKNAEERVAQLQAALDEEKKKNEVFSKGDTQFPTLDLSREVVLFAKRQDASSKGLQVEAPVFVPQEVTTEWVRRYGEDYQRVYTHFHGVLPALQEETADDYVDAYADIRSGGSQIRFVATGADDDVAECGLRRDPLRLLVSTPGLATRHNWPLRRAGP